MKRYAALLLAVVMLITCLPAFASGVEKTTRRSGELSAFTDGSGYLYVSGLGTPVNTTPGETIVGIDAHRIVFFAKEDAALGRSGHQLLSLNLADMTETVITNDAASACMAQDGVYYVSASDPANIFFWNPAIGLSSSVYRALLPIGRIYAVSDGVVAVAADGLSALMITAAGSAPYNREIAEEYAVYDGFDVFETQAGELYACVNDQSILLDTGVSAWAVMGNSVYYLTGVGGLLTLKSYSIADGTWRVVSPVLSGMQAQLTASKTKLFMLSVENVICTVDCVTGQISTFVALPDPSSYQTTEGAVEGYIIQGVSGQINIYGKIAQAQMAPAFTFVQTTQQSVVSAQPAIRLLSAYVINGEQTVYALLQPAAQYSLLQYGSRGDAVSAIQQPLLSLGYYDYKVDGIYGTRTRRAVELLQADLGLEVTGEADAQLQHLILGGTLEPYNPYRTLMQGDTGDRVEKMQKRLRTLGYLADSADGIFGARTLQAVKLFQQQNGLPVSGIAEANTLQLLYDDDAAMCQSFIDLRRGDSGWQVEALNQRLKDLYYLEGSVSNSYRSATKTAVRTFQGVMGFVQNGEASAQLQAALFARNAPENPNYITLSRGDENGRVLEMQKRLKQLGYLSGSTDGEYGEQTQAAVKLFQRAVGLEATGTADVATLQALYALNAPVYVPPVQITVPVISITTADPNSYMDGSVFCIEAAGMSGTQITLEWYADGDVSGYDVTLKDESATVWIDETGVTNEMLSIDYDSLTPGVVYSFTVTAHPETADSGPSTSATLSFMRLHESPTPEESITAPLIVPIGMYDVNEQGYVLYADSGFMWEAQGNVAGYEYVITDEWGNVVSGYGPGSVSTDVSVVPDAADFTPGAAYVLTVTAYAASGDEDFMASSVIFTYAGADEGDEPADQPTDAPVAPEVTPVPTPEPNVITDLFIVPAEDYPVTEGGYVLEDGGAFYWGVNGDAWGYSYIVVDENGVEVSSHTNRGIVQDTALGVYSQDFETGKTYRLVVYAFASATDTEPLVAQTWFVFEPSQDTGEVVQPTPEPESGSSVTDLVIVSSMEIAMLENVCMFENEGMFTWSAQGDVWGYNYEVVDENGTQVAAYPWQYATIDNNYVYLSAGDFESGRIYTLRVCAYDNAEGPEALSAEAYFMFVGDASSEDEPVEEASTNQILRDFFNANYMPHNPVILVDLSQDGENEMIVLVYSEYDTTGLVYGVDPDTGEVNLLYQVSVPTSHGGVCGWYLVPNGESWVLLEEADEMWQGYGQAYYTVYGFTSYGEYVEYYYNCISDSDATMTDSDGRILNSVIETYGTNLGAILETGYVIVSSGSFSYSRVEQLNMVSSFTLEDDAPIGGTDQYYENNIELEEDDEDESDDNPPDDALTTADRVDRYGLIALMGMNYGELQGLLSNLYWFEAYDYPDMWYADGYFVPTDFGIGGGEVSIMLEYGGSTPGDDGAYPNVMTVFDHDGSAWVAITDQLYTGMSYDQVSALYWESLSDLGNYEGLWMAVGYPDQGCEITMLFTEGGGVLTDVIITFFE